MLSITYVILMSLIPGLALVLTGNINLTLALLAISAVNAIIILGLNEIRKEVKPRIRLSYSQEVSSMPEGGSLSPLDEKIHRLQMALARIDEEIKYLGSGAFLPVEEYKRLTLRKQDITNRLKRLGVLEENDNDKTRH